MERPTCETCVHWFKRAQDDKKMTLGECRRTSPSQIWVRFDKGEFKRTYNIVVPQTLIDFWCGEHPDFPVYLKYREKPPYKVTGLSGETVYITPSEDGDYHD